MIENFAAFADIFKMCSRQPKDIGVILSSCQTLSFQGELLNICAGIKMHIFFETAKFKCIHGARVKNVVMLLIVRKTQKPKFHCYRQK